VLVSGDAYPELPHLGSPLEPLYIVAYELVRVQCPGMSSERSGEPDSHSARDASLEK
jgi:hypothetical protein